MTLHLSKVRSESKSRNVFPIVYEIAVISHKRNKSWMFLSLIFVSNKASSLRGFERDKMKKNESIKDKHYQDFVAQLMSWRSGVSFKKLNGKGKLSSRDFEKLYYAADEINDFFSKKVKLRGENVKI